MARAARHGSALRRSRSTWSTSASIADAIARFGASTPKCSAAPASSWVTRPRLRPSALKCCIVQRTRTRCGTITAGARAGNATATGRSSSSQTRSITSAECGAVKGPLCAASAHATRSENEEKQCTYTGRTVRQTGPSNTVATSMRTPSASEACGATVGVCCVEARVHRVSAAAPNTASLCVFTAPNTARGAHGCNDEPPLDPLRSPSCTKLRPSSRSLNSRGTQASASAYAVAARALRGST